MDIWQKGFYYGGAIIAACILLVVIIVLGSAEDGKLTVEGLAHLQEPLTSFYHLFKWFVFLWLIPAMVLFIRLIKRFFGR